MADKSDKNPDKNPDSPEVDENQNEELLAEVENLLNEEDPDFLNRLSKIKVNEDATDISALGLGSGSAGSGFLYIIKQPFDIFGNTKSVVLFWTIFIAITAVILLVWNFKGNLFNDKLFLTSFADLGGEVMEFNPLQDVEDFYDNIHFAKNLVTISQMRANLRNSVNSGPNPMLALEVTVEGLASDAIIEIKDREAEFKDMLLRLTEEKTYDELVEPEGKRIICDQYRDLINTNLTKGQIRKVHIKSFIIKP